MDGHLSRARIAPCFVRPLPEESAGSFILFLFGLAPDGVCQASASPRSWWSLTPPFQLNTRRLRRQHSREQTRKATPECLFFSVALSVGSLPLAVSEHRALRSPDFPPRPLGRGDHLTYSTSIISHLLRWSMKIAVSPCEQASGNTMEARMRPCLHLCAGGISRGSGASARRRNAWCSSSN